MCLLHLLHKSGYLMIVACLDHGIRPEAVDEIALVQKYTQDLGVEFITRSVDTPAFASRHVLSTEAAARQLRYDFLYEAARQMDAVAVLVAHTADDQAETVLLHLFRGAGLAGLKGMEFRSYQPSWSSEIPLVRPLLTTWRVDVLEYCQQNHLPTAQDATNQSLDYFRNRIRHEVLPFLEQSQPNLRQHLVRMAGTLAVDYELLQNQVDAAWNICMAYQGVGYVAFKRQELVNQPIGIQRYLFRRAMLAYRTGLQDIEFAMIERARAYLSGSSGTSSHDIGAGLRLLLEPDLAWIETREAILPAAGWPSTVLDRQLELPVPGTLELQNGWVLTIELGEYDHNVLVNHQDHFHAWFDADSIARPLLVRTRMPGDRLKPLGMGGRSVKISDLMINLKLPHRSRSTWPVVCAGEQIVWVPGCRVSETAQLSQATRRVLHLTLIKPSAPGANA
jgi:tRNA(Ile)-lysidine synthase